MDFAPPPPDPEARRGGEAKWGTPAACVGVAGLLMGGGTDNKALASLGIAGYGFAPLRLPADLDFTGMFHGVDERVPVESLVFGQRVLGDLLRTC